jgi:NitT/TauT family transport system permease protein
MSKLKRNIIFFVILVLVWQALALMNIWEDYIFPAPLAVLKTLIADISNGSLEKGIAVSMKRLVVGYGISLVLGVMLGLMLARVKVLDDTVGSLFLGLQTLPSICWLPLALLWFGLNEDAIIFVVVMGAVVSIAISTDIGVKNVSPIYVRAARNMGARGYRLYCKVVIPAALPSMIAGMKLGWSFAWRSLMAGELLFMSGGLGQLLHMGRELNDMSQVAAVMLVIIAIGWSVDRLLFAALERDIRRRWGFEKT